MPGIAGTLANTKQSDENAIVSDLSTGRYKELIHHQQCVPCKTENTNKYTIQNKYVHPLIKL